MDTKKVIPFVRKNLKDEIVILSFTVPFPFSYDSSCDVFSSKVDRVTSYCISNSTGLYDRTDMVKVELSEVVYRKITRFLIFSNLI